MCGIAGLFGKGWDAGLVDAMVELQNHRGPDARGTYRSPEGLATLGHTRLRIVDLSDAGNQPMSSGDGRLWLAYNGEIYNHRELRRELSDYPYRSNTDTEIVLAAYQRWGEACLDRFVGMFAFLLWDERARRLFGARDRFGVKPLYFHHRADGGLAAASEISALHAAGIGREPDLVTWSTYLTHGLLDHSERTFWHGISALPPGHCLTWDESGLRVRPWYDLADRAPDLDRRPLSVVEDEYLGLLEECVRLRFRSDVPVGVNLSGGLDSSVLSSLVRRTLGPVASAPAFTFVTGEPNYDETPWVRGMLGDAAQSLIECGLSASDVPSLADAVWASQREPFGGIPTLAYARLCETARRCDVPVLLDGQGMDEQWAGYDYYARAGRGEAPIIQGTRDPVTRPDLLAPDFRALAEPFEAPTPFPRDPLRNLQYRDIRHTKLPRALRFNDRVSMRSSIELREPFLDHRLVELAFAQPRRRKISEGTSKWMLRRLARRLVPNEIAIAPKRAVQSPQREWLRGPLASWARELAAEGHDHFRDWFREEPQLPSAHGDNSNALWQWLSVGLLARTLDAVATNQEAGCLELTRGTDASRSATRSPDVPSP